MPIASTGKVGVLLDKHEVSWCSNQYTPTVRLHRLKGNTLLSNLKNSKVLYNLRYIKIFFMYYYVIIVKEIYRQALIRKTKF